MDQIIRQFTAKTPVQLLDDHRRHSRSESAQSTFNVYRFDLHHFGNFPSEDSVIAGSMAEGASLARLFSPDDKTSGELELDFMIPFKDWHWEEDLKYVDNNKAFVHLTFTNPMILKQIRLLCGEDAVQRLGIKIGLFCQIEDRIYMSSQVMRIWFKEWMALSPDAFSKFAGRPCIGNNRCKAGNAAVSLSFDLEAVMGDRENAEESPSCGSELVSSITGFGSKQAEVCANATEKCNQIKALYF